MRILVDFTQIPLERTGVGVYADHLVLELCTQLRSMDTLLVLAQSDEKAVMQYAGNALRVRVLKVPAKLFRNRAALLLFEQIVLPLLLMYFSVDVVHSLHYTFPLISPCARVVTLHDMTFSLFPELHTRGRRLLFPFFIRQALQRAECPVFVSVATQIDAERLFGQSRHPGHVTPLGVSHVRQHAPEAADQAVLAELGVQEPYVLFVGTLEPRKNIGRIVKAFEKFVPKHSEYSLVLVGKLGWHTEEIVTAIQAAQTCHAVQHLGFVTEEQKAALLLRCAMLIYPSLYEGFGLPVLEAMAYGAPVITSDRSSMPEVAGDAGLLVNPESVEEIVVAMEQIASDRQMQMRLRAAGPIQAARFSWKQTAEESYRAYEQALVAH